MFEDNKSKIIRIILKYGITVIAASALTILALLARDFNELTEKVDIYRALADSFTIPGVLLIMFGILIALANEGALDFLGYAFKWLSRSLIPVARSKGKDQTYMEYVESRKKLSGYAFLFVVGLIFLGIGIIFTILFNKVA